MHVRRLAPLVALPLLLVGCATTPAAMTPVPSDVERNKAAIKRWMLEGDNKGNPAIADEVFAPDVVMYHPTSPTPLKGVEVIKQGSMGLHASFPGFVGTVDDVVAEGDKVTVRWTVTGVHKGPFIGIPATNKPFKLQGISIYRFAGGKIVEAWYAADMEGFYRQIGVTPPDMPAAAPAPVASPKS